MSIQENYLAGLGNGARHPHRVDSSIVRQPQLTGNLLEAINRVSGILSQESIPTVLVGSSSAHIQQTAQRGTELLSHDLDLVIEDKRIGSALKILAAGGFNTWDESKLHRIARNYSGGFGRHHAYAASSPKHLDKHNLPIWIGFHPYTIKPEGIEFKEHFAVSQFKVLHALRQVKGVGLSGIQQILAREFTLENIQRTVGILASHGLDFWQLINNPETNALDVARREKLRPTEPKQMLEATRRELYRVDPDQYFLPAHVQLSDTSIDVACAEGAFLRMTQFHPHYLGPRPKYKVTARAIKDNVPLDPYALSLQEQIYADRQVSHEAREIFRFTSDDTFDPDKLGQSISNGDIDNWAILLNRVHFTNANE